MVFFSKESQPTVNKLLGKYSFLASLTAVASVQVHNIQFIEFSLVLLLLEQLWKIGWLNRN